MQPDELVNSVTGQLRAGLHRMGFFKEVKDDLEGDDVVTTEPKGRGATVTSSVTPVAPPPVMPAPMGIVCCCQSAPCLFPDGCCVFAARKYPRLKSRSKRTPAGPDGCCPDSPCPNGCLGEQFEGCCMCLSAAGVRGGAFDSRASRRWRGPRSVRHRRDFTHRRRGDGVEVRTISTRRHSPLDNTQRGVGRLGGLLLRGRLRQGRGQAADRRT